MKNMKIKTLQKLHDKMQMKINKALEQFAKETGIVIGDNIGVQYDIDEEGFISYSVDVHAEDELLFINID